MDPRSSSTTAQLKDDIDSGRTGDKVANADPSLVPLGTDDEAGGNPYTAAQTDLARRTQAKAFAPVRDTKEKPTSGPLILGFCIAAVVVVLIVGAVYWPR